MPEFIPDPPKNSQRYFHIFPSRNLQLTDPVKWIVLAWFDFSRAPFISLMFGGLFLIIPWSLVGILYLAGWHLIMLPALLSFVLVGPHVASGLYAICRQIHMGRVPRAKYAMLVIKKLALKSSIFALILMIVALMWMEMTLSVHQMFEQNVTHSLSKVIPFIVSGTLVGIVFSLVLFCISVFTQPLILEKKADVLSAVLTSINCVWQNKYVMLIWASIISLFVSISLVSGFVGFAVVMPLLSFASWHGYRDCMRS